MVGISPDAKTGFGTQTRGILEALSQEHDVFSIGHGGDAIVWGGTRSYRYESGLTVPLYTMPNPLVDPEGAKRIVQEYAKMLRLDLVLAHWDLFPLAFLRDAEIPYIAYVPVDGPMTALWYDYAKNCQRIVAFCEYGTREFLKFAPPAQVARIPHGLDTSVFRPLDIDRAVLRRGLPYTPAIPEDAFLLMHVGTNVTERKQLPLLLRALAKFAKLEPRAHLLLHTNPLPQGGQGYQLPLIARDLGISDRVHFPQKNPILVGADDEEMNRAYNAADYYVTLSQGEGWGVPLAEAMATGTPVIAGDNSSQTELVKGRGFLYRMVPGETFVDYPMYTPYGSWFPVPDIESLLDSMMEARNSPDRERLARKCRSFAEQFDWKLVGPQWRKLVVEVGDEVDLFRSILW